VNRSRPLTILMALMALTAMLSGCGAGSDPVTPTAVLDDAPPQAPTGLSGGQGTDGAPTLEWNANAEPDLSAYQIYQYSPDPSRDNAYELVATVGAGSTEWTVPPASESGLVWFRMRAVDATGNRSAVSAAAPVMVFVGSSGPESPGEDVNPLRP
jgi:hypothetical protein